MDEKYSKEEGKIFLDYVKFIVADKLKINLGSIVDVSKHSEKRGVFVTLHKNGKLRGCVGFPYPVYPLNTALKKASLFAAFSDDRFLPVNYDEFDELEFEISVLTVPKEIIVIDKKNIISQIEIGQDGLIVELEGASGLLLPQVATENNLDKKSFLELTCVKAGLPKNSWLDKNCKVYKFQAQIFN